MMHLQTKSELGNNWSCTALSFAMAFDVNVSSMTATFGHDGSRIVDPYVAEPTGRQGFHVQECVFYGLAIEKTCTPFEIVPVSQVSQVCCNLGSEERLNYAEYLIRHYRGVIIGHTRPNDHAVAFDQGVIYDSSTENFDGSPVVTLQDLIEDVGIVPQTIWVVGE